MKRFWLLVFAFGCAAGGKGGEFADCDADGLSGMASADVDGIDWTASDGSWMEAGSSIQINLESDIGLNLNLRAIRSSSGDSIADLVSSGALPVVVDLAGEDGSGSIMDQRTGLDSYASSQPGGSGSMSLLSLEGSTLTACFNFDAVNSDGVIMQVRDGKVQING